LCYENTLLNKVPYLDNPLSDLYIKNKSTTQDCQQKHHLKFAYVDLPGHSFYGQRVQIIQEGRTDTMVWCLISHPTKEGLHYRISTRWLCEKAPSKHLTHSQGHCQNPIPIKALEKLAIFLKTLSCSDDRDITGKGETKKVGEMLFFAIVSGRGCHDECDVKNSGKSSSEESGHIYPTVFCPASGKQ
jgi:hypothetical protein